MTDRDPLLAPFDAAIVAAPRLHRDRYAGFSVAIPRGWVVANGGFGSHYAPSGTALFVFNEHQDSLGKPALFTISISSHQGGSALETARAQSQDGSYRRITVAGRRAYRVRDSICAHCARELILVQWDRGTVIDFSMNSGPRADLIDRRGIFLGIVASLRSASRDRYAVAVRDFLRARAAGRGAGGFLSAKAARSFDRRNNLYRTHNCGDIKGYSVDWVGTVPGLGTVYEVDSGGVEAILVGPGRNVFGQPRPMVVLDHAILLECGTS